MRALLLAAGLGTRLRPITNSIPKCMVPIYGKPLLGYWLDALLTNGDIERVLVNTHYLPEHVNNYISTSQWCSKVEIVHESELLGTGGTIVNVSEFFGDQAFMIVHADNLSRFNIADFIRSHEKRPAGSMITMMTFKTDQPKNSGIVELNEDGVVVVEFHEKVEKPPGNLANGAVYIFEPEVINFLLELNKPFIDLSTEVLPNYLGKINTFLNSDYHRDIGTLESLNRAKKEYSN